LQYQHHGVPTVQPIPIFFENNTFDSAYIIEMKTFFVFLSYFYATYCFPLNNIWLKVVNTYRSSTGVREKLLMFVATGKMKGCYKRSVPMFLLLTSSL